MYMNFNRIVQSADVQSEHVEYFFTWRIVAEPRELQEH